jgi:hypothetical protein
LAENTCTSYGISAVTNLRNAGAALAPLVGPAKTVLDAVVVTPIPPLDTGKGVVSANDDPLIAPLTVRAVIVVVASVEVREAVKLVTLVVASVLAPVTPNVPEIT